MGNLTIGWLPTVREKNGTEIKDFNKTEVCTVADTAKSKTDLPALYTYTGKKGTYSPSNVFFLDIDTTDGVETIIENCDELFAKIPFIYSIQKSHSGKLHIIGVYNEVKPDEQSWKYDTTVYSLAVCKKIKSIFGVDYIESNALDAHQIKYSQGLFFSKEPFIINDFVTPVKISVEDERKFKQSYPEFFESFCTEYNNSTTQVSVKDIDIDFKSTVGKLLINKDYQVGNYSGNDLRWRIGSYLICTYGEEQARVIVDRLFENPEEFSFYDKGVNQRIKNWFESTFPFIPEKTFIKQEENRITKIEIDTDKWMSDYIDTIEEYISKEQILTISAPTGTGKTTMLEAITKKYHRNATILVPFNVTNNLYRWSNIVCSSEVNEYHQGKVNTMVWDQFIKNYKEIEHGSDVLFVDESHTLFLDRKYRDAAVEVWGRFQTWIQLGKKIVFVSATPAGEIQKTNSKVLKFVKKDDRNVMVNCITTNDTLTALETDIKSTEYDRVCVFSDRDVKILYARMCVTGRHTDAKIYHSEWLENVNELKTTEKLTARVNLLTCIAFNGLNIRNENEKILISMRYTEEDTTPNEIIQIIGRFRRNKNITLNIYIDNKFTTSEDLEELFLNATAITDYENNNELKSEYYERLSDSSVQDALREIDAYGRMWTLGNIMRYLKSRYHISIMNKTFQKEHVVKRVNPIKKQASELMIKLLTGVITDEDFREAYVGTNMEGFIHTWERELTSLKMRVGENTGIIDVVIAECGKQNTLVENAIKKIKHIVWVVGMNTVQWDCEVASRDGITAMLRGTNMIKRAMSQFKKDDDIRRKYAEYIVEWVEGSVSEGGVGDPFDGLFKSVVDDINVEVRRTVNKKSIAHSKPHKSHKLQLFKNVETGEMMTKPEWCKKLKYNVNGFDYLIKKGTYIKA